jgi:hypothetical protein
VLSTATTSVMTLPIVSLSSTSFRQMSPTSEPITMSAVSAEHVLPPSRVVESVNSVSQWSVSVTTPATTPALSSVEAKQST